MCKIKCFLKLFHRSHLIHLKVRQFIEMVAGADTMEIQARQDEGTPGPSDDRTDDRHCGIEDRSRDIEDESTGMEITDNQSESMNNGNNIR